MAFLSLQSEGQGQCFVPLCFLPLLVREQTLKHPHPLKIYEQSPNFPPPAKKEKQQQQPKKIHQRTPKKTKRTPKQSLAVENRQTLAGQKNSVLKSPSLTAVNLDFQTSACHARLGTPDVTTAQAVLPVRRNCNQMTKISSHRFSSAAATLFHNILCFNFI